MALINCSKHGFQGAELVSPKLQRMILEDKKYTGKIHPISIKFDDLEFPRYITYEELVETGLEKNFSDGLVVFDNEQDAERAIGLFVPVCLKCLNEFVLKNGLSLE